jgi:hypothetical protein
LFPFRFPDRNLSFSVIPAKALNPGEISYKELGYPGGFPAVLGHLKPLGRLYRKTAVVRAESMGGKPTGPVA